MNTMFSRWLPAITQTSAIRKTALGVAGVAFAGGAIAGPAATALAAPDHTPTATAAAVQVARPGLDKLSPRGVQGEQASIPLGADETNNAKAIIHATKHNGMDERAAVIAVGTSLQESKLQNLGSLGDANDHDSLGLFQQRPSSGWGSPEQITNPEYSTASFLKGLKQVDGWHDMPLTQAAQKVQVSAYPDAYAKWEKQATDLVGTYWNS
jgi:hypothetical protein